LVRMAPPGSIHPPSSRITPVLAPVLMALHTIVTASGRRFVHHRALPHRVHMNAPEHDAPLDEGLRLPDVIHPVWTLSVIPAIAHEVDVAPLVVLSRIDGDVRRRVFRTGHATRRGFGVAPCHAGAQDEQGNSEPKHRASET
jgi:hypothetical protein